MLVFEAKVGPFEPFFAYFALFFVSLHYFSHDFLRIFLISILKLSRILPSRVWMSIQAIILAYRFRDLFAPSFLISASVLGGTIALGFVSAPVVSRGSGAIGASLAA
jgi:hypothetical protein